MVDINFKIRMLIATILTMLWFVVLLIAVKFVSISLNEFYSMEIGFAIGAFGYQIIDYFIWKWRHR